MKKILSFIVLLVSVTPVFAQIYLRANIGYNLPANAQVLGTNYYERGDEDYINTEEVVSGSYGSGLSFHLGVGASFNGTLGYDIEAGYLIGKQYSSSYRYESDFYTERASYTMSARSFQLAPALTFTAGTGSVQPYSRIGPVIAFTKLLSTLTEEDSYMNNEEEIEIEMTGGVSLGFKGVLGITFNSDKKLQFFCEANFISMSTAPKKGVITGYKVDGEDALNSIPKENREVKLKDKVTYGGDNEQIREKYPMGGIGLQAGVKYVLK